jgi:hypothetical protein
MRVDDRQRAPADRAGGSENGDPLHSVLTAEQVAGRHSRRRDEQERVDPIEDAAVPGNEVRTVLQAGLPLQPRLEQITGDAEHDDRDPERASPPTPAPGNTHGPRGPRM